MEAIVINILQMFFVTRMVLKIWEYHTGIPQYYLGIFSPVMHLDQYHMSENV